MAHLYRAWYGHRRLELRGISPNVFLSIQPKPTQFLSSFGKEEEGEKSIQKYYYTSAQN